MAQVERIPEYAKTSRNFLNPIEELELKDAVAAKKKKITLGGRKFTIRYEKDKIFIQIEKGFVPCGWFAIERLGEFE